MPSKRLIVIHGMKRSGNHALARWIQAQTRGPFFNNVVPTTPIILGLGPARYPVTYGALDVVDRYISGHEEATGCAEDTIVSVEDHRLDVLDHTSFPMPVLNLLIVRDPWNLFASRIKKAFSVHKPQYPRSMGFLMERVINIWKSHASEFLGRTNTLPDATMVSFTRWFSDEAYRRRLAARLILDFDDAEYYAVSAIGGGSSFNGMAYDGRANEMDVLNRSIYLTSRQKRLLDRIMEDAELVEMGSLMAGGAKTRRHA